jgi:hypothetical protein
LFVERLDQVGCDIRRQSGDLGTILTKALDDPTCIAANTYGYLKHNVFFLEPVACFGLHDGIYIKRSFLDKSALPHTLAVKYDASRARFHQDVIVASCLVPRDPAGVVVEVTARDSMFESSSHYFCTHLKWRGIVIEANADVFAAQIAT